MRTIRVDRPHPRFAHFGVLARIVDGAPSRRPSTVCPECGSILELLQPAHVDAGRVVGTCAVCDTWFVFVDAGTTWERYAIVELPTVTAVRRQLGVD